MSSSSTMFLRVVHSPLRCGASTFWVRLEGTVPEVLVGKINAELTMERAANAELADCCPALRLERGFWEFFSTASSTFHKDILLKCFVLPVTLEGWSNIAEYNPHSGSINYGWVAAISGSTTALDCTQTFVKTGPLEETYRPLSATTNGGNGQIVSYNTLGSLVVQPDTVYYDLHADGPMSLFGFGWDAERNPIYTMLASAGVGSSVEPDLDLTINVLNRFGEIITQLSPKGVRTIPGVTIGPDATDGQGDGDDEIVVFEWPKIHPAVHSIALSISIQNGADSFRSIRNVFCRLVDVGSSRKSLEVWRYVVPHESGPTTARSAILAIIERRPVDGWPSADTDLKAGAAGAPEAAAGDADAPWRVRTVEGYDKDPHIGFIIPKNGDILRQINGEDAKSCTGGLTSGIAQLAQGVLNGFAENKRRIDMLPRPLMLTFERPAAYADGGAGHRLAASGDPHAGTTFTLTFISEDIGVQFAERSAAMVVSGVRGLSLVCPAPGAPSPGGWLRDQAVAMATLAQMKIPGRAIAHSTLPVAIKISNVTACVPACDRNGLTDPYLRVVEYKLKEGGARVLAALTPLKGREAVELLKTPVQKKVKCPAEISFPGAEIQIPISSVASRLLKFQIQVLDYDKLSRNDKILTHSIDLTWMFAGSNKEQVVLRPEFVGAISDQKANAGFTKDSVRLSFTAELIFA